MCGILLTKQYYNSNMAHRGLREYRLNIDEYQAIHHHLPIQAKLTDYPIIDVKNLVILFNGEIFLDDYDNDLEYIKQVFTKYQVYDAINLISQQDGFYSFIIYDKIKRITYAFTDPLGKKQLYYSDNAIGSEIKAVKTPESEIDKTWISDNIKFGYVSDERTCYLNVKRCIPNILYAFGKEFQIINSRKIYSFKPNNDGNLIKILEKSVLNRLKGHEKIGLLLSGGLDSSIIHYFIKKSNTDFNCYCIENEKDLEFARLVNKNVIPIQQIIDPTALSVMEYPTDLGSMYTQYSLFKQADETVVITGDGADEAFGGYDRMKLYDSQYSDIFTELPYYHNPRIDKMSMNFTKEARSPFMSIPVIEFALSLKYKDRQNKTFLRETFKHILPKSVYERNKVALKNDLIRKTDPVIYRNNLTIEWRNKNGF